MDFNTIVLFTHPFHKTQLLMLNAGKVLLMLGKVQFVIQNLVDRYVGYVYIGKLFRFLLRNIFLLTSHSYFVQRSHIFQTITIPSESLLNELRIVEVSSYKVVHRHMKIILLYSLCLCFYKLIQVYQKNTLKFCVETLSIHIALLVFV